MIACTEKPSVHVVALTTIQLLPAHHKDECAHRKIKCPQCNEETTPALRAKHELQHFHKRGSSNRTRDTGTDVRVPIYQNQLPFSTLASEEEDALLAHQMALEMEQIQEDALLAQRLAMETEEHLVQTRAPGIEGKRVLHMFTFMCVCTNA